MKDSNLISDRLPPRRLGNPEEYSDDAEDLGAFGVLRGVRDRSYMIEFRRKNGNRDAFAYSTLERVTFDPSEGITLHFLCGTVRLRGRNFTTPSVASVSLLDAIQRHRVPWVREVEELRGKVQPAGAVVITGIEVKERK